MNWLAISILAIAGAADLATTYVGMLGGATEMNPIARVLGDDIGSVMVAATVTKVVGIFIAGILPPVPQIVAAITIGAMWFGGAVFNVYNIYTMAI